jgi:predicted RNase H-like HicB family nuclease
MAKLNYSIVIEATNDPNYFGFYSPDLEGFSGSGRSIQDCIIKAVLAMDEFVALLRQEGLPIPSKSSNATICIENGEKLVQSMTREMTEPARSFAVQRGAGAARSTGKYRTRSYRETGRIRTSDEARRIVSHPRTVGYSVRNQDKADVQKRTAPRGRKHKNK